MTLSTEARRIEVRGVVQGVGYRPFVLRLARELRLHGWVVNDTVGVTIHAEGIRGDLECLIERLRAEAPPAALVQSIDGHETPVNGYRGFEIRASQRSSATTTRISPDLATCRECLRELHNPADRRFRYPYINCTCCGPRFSIVRSLPYDRPNTTMAPWQLCSACQAEYDDVFDRRYHAQPTACPVCGPHFYLVVDRQPVASGDAAIVKSAQMLSDGAILAIKGIGGYHLACDATNRDSIHQLRERKYRKEKPFAVMVRDIEGARAIAHIDTLHESLLTSTARPIVLAPARIPLPGIAPDRDEIGVMIPYAPLHPLLFLNGAPSPLVLTSGNRSSEPIAYTEDDALDRLAGIADAFLVGERPIERRVDDSVVAIRGGNQVMVRRARGYAPGTVATLPRHERPILAVGADLKNAVTLVVNGEAIVSQHIGDLGDLETDQALRRIIDDLLAMYDIRKQDLLIAHDLHPEFISTRMAQRWRGHRCMAVQHHRAHVASVMAEHGALDEPVFGFVLDGTGYGDDGSIWGLEVFVGSVREGLQRVAHLLPAALPGGDVAARYPVQAAAGFLAALDLDADFTGAPFEFPPRYNEAAALLAGGTRCFPSSSAGRLFDTVAALCGYTRENTYEGQAACWLEYQAHGANQVEAYPFPDFDFRPLLTAIVADRRAGRIVGEIAYAFHASVATAIAEMARRLELQHGPRRVALSGGTFQNRLLCRLVAERITTAPLLFNLQVPCNDGGISLGQAAIAAVGSQTGGPTEPQSHGDR